MRFKAHLIVRLLVNHTAREGKTPIIDFHDGLNTQQRMHGRIRHIRVLKCDLAINCEIEKRARREQNHEPEYEQQAATQSAHDIWPSYSLARWLLKIILFAHS